MKTEPARDHSGRSALANLSSAIESLEGRVARDAPFDELATLSQLLFLRGDLLGRIHDHDRAEAAAEAAAASRPGTVEALLIRARVAARFHRFAQAHCLLDRAAAAGAEDGRIDATRAALFQASGDYPDALALRNRLAREQPGIDSLGALATLFAQIGRWATAEALYAQALQTNHGLSPLPCAQLLFEWGVGAMRRGELEHAERIFAQLETVLPSHVPGRGHRAELALARGRVDTATALIESVVEVSDHPVYLAIHAEVLEARGNPVEAAIAAQRAGAAYAELIARRPAAYADDAVAFFIGVGKQPLLAVELAAGNWALGDTPRSRALLAKAQWAARVARTSQAADATHGQLRGAA